jgi:glycosyltransferase involved in cell wall biosynthesis
MEDPGVHLVALVESPEHVCCRYRVTAFRRHLEQVGHSLGLCCWPRSWWSRLHLHRQLRHADAVIIQRRLLARWQLLLFRRIVPFLLFDLDDAVFLRDSYAAAGLHSPQRLRRFAAVARAADAVVAGNSFLAAAAGRWTNSQRVHVIPTCVDPARYPVAPHCRRGAGVQLVWIGSASTLQGLECIRPWLEELGQRQSGLILKLICDRFIQLHHLTVQACPWSESGEAEALASADVGISWVPDDLWSRGKCGLKVLQYMAAGLPVIANPVGVQAEMVRHGVTGFLAETPGQWLEAITRLALDPDLRRRQGQAGRRRVEVEFSVTTGAARWRTLLDELGQRRRVG